MKVPESVVRKTCSTRCRFQLVFTRRVAFQNRYVTEQRDGIGMMQPVILGAHQLRDRSGWPRRKTSSRSKPRTSMSSSSHSSCEASSVT